MKSIDIVVPVSGWSSWYSTGADKNIKNKEGAFYNEVKSFNRRLFSDENNEISIETY